MFIREDTAELDRAIEDSFPGALLELPPPGQTASFGLRFADFPTASSKPPSYPTARCATSR